MRLQPLPGPERGEAFAALMTEVVDYLAVWDALEPDLQAWARLSRWTREWVEVRWLAGATSLASLADVPNEIRMAIRDHVDTERDDPDGMIRRLESVGADISPTDRDRPSGWLVVQPELVWLFVDWPFAWELREPPGDNGVEDRRWLHGRHMEYLWKNATAELTIADMELSVLRLIRQLDRDLVSL